MAYKQGLLFIKFKECDKFKEMLKEIRVSKSTIYFKVKTHKIVRKVSQIQ